MEIYLVKGKCLSSLCPASDFASLHVRTGKGGGNLFGQTVQFSGNKKALAELVWMS